MDGKLNERKWRRSNMTLLRSFCAPKIVPSWFIIFFIFVSLGSFYLFCVFSAAKVFLIRNSNCPDSLIYYTTV